jgi:hypothetical protein
MRREQAALPMMDAEDAIETLRLAARHNRDDPLRRGSLLEFPNYGQLVMTGDLHGHERNFEKLVKFCDLQRFPVRHVILHELVHAEPEQFNGPEFSARLVVRTAEWKVQFPDQVHFLQSNHELAQLTGQEITKGGRTVIYDFNEGVAELFGRENTSEVLASINEFIASFPYAGRTPNNILLAHSLPDAADLDLFDPDFFTHPPSVHDFKEDSNLYRLVWGRDHTVQLLEQLGQAYDVDFFIVGHQPQETGWFVQHARLLILASDHNHGVFLPIDLSKPVDMDQLVSRIRAFVSVP